MEQGHSPRMASLRLVLGLTCAALVLVFAPSAAAIVNGSPDGNRHPYVVFVGQQVVTPAGPVNTQACSGSLVGPSTVVTAAHCSVVFTPRGIAPLPKCSTATPVFCVRWVVRQGENMRAPTGETLAASFDVAPGFCATCPFVGNNDLGVITLAAPLDGPYAKLPKLESVAKRFRKERTATIVGYGVDAPGASPATLGPRRYGKAEARLFAGDLNLLELPVPTRSNRAAVACTGDSGGPVLKGKTLQAVISFGDNACGGPTYALRLDTNAAQSFLATYVDLRGSHGGDDDERDDDSRDDD